MRWLFELLFPERADARIVRALSPEAFRALYAPCSVAATRPAGVALLPFADQRVRAVVHEAKYRGSEAAFALLADTLAAHLRQAGHDPARARIIPLPLSAKRRRERGFNQVEEVARRAAGNLGIQLETGLLVRVRDTVSQVSLPRAKRLENMRGAFGAAHDPDPAYLYIVVDDVLTTGATMQAALDALIEAGARTLIPIALSH